MDHTTEATGYIARFLGQTLMNINASVIIFPF